MPESRSLPGRYSRVPLPAYRHVPGRTPHPVRDPRGHSFGHSGPVEPVEAMGANDWPSSEPYLYAVDLFNFGYLWETHEALEEPWRRAGAHSDIGARLHGVILVAAGLLQLEMNTPRGARRLVARGAAALRTGPAGLLGFDGPELAAAAIRFVDGRLAERPRIRLVGVAPLEGDQSPPSRSTKTCS